MVCHKPFRKLVTGGAGWYTVKKLTGLMPMAAIINAVRITGV
jgi:hypothetical protein